MTTTPTATKPVRRLRHFYGCPDCASWRTAATTST
jgi:hypothetical protein